MDPENKRRYVPAPAPPPRMDTRKRLQLRLELNHPTQFVRRSESEIKDLVRKTLDSEKAPGGELTARTEAFELETSLRIFQRELAQKERELRDKELAIEETLQLINRRATALAEARRLIAKQKIAYESGLNAASAAATDSTSGADNLRALKELQLKIEQQTRTLDEGKEWLHEREAFIEESEKILFDKMQAQQERETELDQREEALAERAARLKRIEAELAPHLDDEAGQT